MKKNNGFTVVELLITIALIGIVVVISVGLGRSAVQRAAFTSAVSNFVADFSYMKQLAARENRYVALKFSNDGMTYNILRQRSVTDKTVFDAVAEKRNIKPLGDRPFWTTNQDFAVNSKGEVFKFKSGGTDLEKDPSQVTLTFFIKKNPHVDSYDYRKNVFLYPYGGIKVEK